MQSLEGAGRAVLLEVLRRGPISRADLARRMDLSTASLTRLTRPLILDGLVRERPATLLSTTGRPALPLEIVAEAASFLGFKIVHDALFGVVTDFAGSVLSQYEVGLDDNSAAAVLAVISGETTRLRRRYPRVVAVGVAIGGMVAEHSIVWSVPALGWDTLDLEASLRDRLQLPVTVEGDVRAFTHAEHWFGAGRGLRSFAVVTVGVGVGAGFVCDDQVVIGHRGLAGMVGHWPLDATGPPCEFGHRGCAESLLSVSSLERRARTEFDRDMSFAELMALAAGGEPVASRIAADAAFQLGRLTGLVANVLAPERILLSGDGIEYALLAEPEVRRGVRDTRHPRTASDDVVIERLEFFAWARGAAAMAIREHVNAKGPGWYADPPAAARHG
ncbi:MAG TPA: ROK family transcriptional regulator [Propionibacteriaceae bacterium]|nr:ROK family transcriptional regulator [Propionibacteriaceae bacterium]